MEILHWLLMVVGLAGSFLLLVKGANFFVDGCVSIAKLLRVPDLIIGLTIVAMGTSAPEAAVSISGAISNPDNAGITLGNLVGSNILNILVILGVSAAIVPITVDKSLLKKDFPFMLLSAVIVPLLFWLCGMQATRLGGILLMVIFAVYMFLTIRGALSKKDAAPDPETAGQPLSIPKSILYAIGGLAVVIGGGQLAVYCAKDIARGMGISESLIGLTIVALGTSLPELITSVVSAKKGNSDLALGNVVGSNLFNIFLVLGLSMTIAPFGVGMTDMIDALCLVAVSILCFLAAWTAKTVNRWEGVGFLGLYAVYLGYIILRDMVF